MGRPSRSRIKKLLLHPSTLPIDVQCTLGQCKDKFKKMKDKHNVEKKKLLSQVPPQTSFNMRNSIPCLLVLLKWMECPMVLIKEYALLVKRLML
jgi:hypothetical protein